MAVGKTTSDCSDLPDALLEEAIRWHARLREPDPSGKTRTAFEQWLSADARHIRASAEAQALWVMLGQPVARVMSSESAGARPAASRRPIPARRTGIAVAACLVVLLGLAVSRQTGVLDNLRSDYVTAVGRRRTVSLADGSQIILNTDTAMAVAFEPDRRVVRLYRGEAWFAVAHNTDRPFIVQTPGGDVRVTGTHFNVRLKDGRAIVSLLEGRVELTADDATGKAVILSPGEQGIVTARGVDTPKTFDTNAVTAWQHGQLVFYQAPLAEVVEQLNRYRPGWIMLASALRPTKVTGVFGTNNPDAALSVIQDTLHINALHISNSLILLH